MHCLSQAIRDDVLTEHQHRISEDCRKQVNFELLAEFEHIKLNPELAKNCKEDIKNFCTNVKQGSKIGFDLYPRVNIYVKDRAG